MKIPLHETAASFPCVYPNTGNGKRTSHHGNGYGNKPETNGNETAFLETNWKRAAEALETGTLKNTPKKSLPVSINGSLPEMKSVADLVAEVLAVFFAQIERNQAA